MFLSSYLKILALVKWTEVNNITFITVFRHTSVSYRFLVFSIFLRSPLTIAGENQGC